MVGRDERVAVVEGRIEEQALRMNDVREALVSLEARMDRRFERIEERFEVRFAGIDRRLDGLDAKFGRLTGVMIAMLIAIIGGLSGVIAAILRH